MGSAGLGGGAWDESASFLVSWGGEDDRGDGYTGGGGGGGGRSCGGICGGTGAGSTLILKRIIISKYEKKERKEVGNGVTYRCIGSTA